MMCTYALITVSHGARSGFIKAQQQHMHVMALKDLVL